MVNDGVVTAVFPDGSYYVEDSDRTCGIGITGGQPPNVGDKVRIAGTITALTGEAQIDATACVTSGTGSVQPLGMPNKLLGGGGFDPAGSAQWQGTKQRRSLGRTWGTLTYVDPAGTFAYLDDGSMLSDGNALAGNGSSVTGVRIVLPSGVVVPGTGSILTLTGISSCDTISGSLVRALHIRNQADIMTAFAENPSVSGNVVLQDWLAPIAEMPVNVQLRPHGGTTITTSVNLDSAGNYTITGVAPGVYDFAFKASHWLQRVVTNVTVSENVSGIDASLINGDCNGDNVINYLDLSMLAIEWGNYWPMADLNGDGYRGRIGRGHHVEKLEIVRRPVGGLVLVRGQSDISVVQ